MAGLGGDNRFLRHEGRAEYYYPILPDVVANLGASAGYIFGFAGEDVHLSNRFFVGGNNLRGFQFGGIGPRDRDTDDKLGGNLYYVGSAEVRFPLGLPEELRIFGRTFVDAGSLSDIDVSGPELDESDGLRVGGRRRALLAVAAGSAVDRFRAGDPQGGRRQHGVLPPVLRHPVLMRRWRPSGGDPRARRRRDGALRSRWPPLLAARPGEPAPAQEKLPAAVVAVIDYQRILREAKAARAIRDQVESRRSSTRTRSPREEQRLHEADKELARQRGILSAEAFSERRSAFEAEVAAVQRMVQERRRQLDQVAAASLNEVRSAMIEVVGELSDARGFNLVLPTSGLLLFSPKIDLTDEVLARLDQKLPNIRVPGTGRMTVPSSRRRGDRLD